MAKLALFGGDRTVTANRVSPPWPRFSRKVANTVAKMIEEGRVSSLGTGEIVAECEEAFAKYHGVKYTLAVSSGTASLHCAVAGCDIAPGDEVITSPYS